MKKIKIRAFFYFLATLLLVASNYLLASAADLVWSTKTIMPTARRYLAASVVNNKIYAIGGYSTTYKEVEEYNPATDTWSAKASLLKERGLLSTAVVNNKIYAFCGQYGMGTEGSVEEYDVTADTWVAKTTYNGGTGVFVGVVNDKIYCIGGGAFAVYYDQVYEYNPVANTLTPKTAMPVTKRSGATAVINNKIYCIGGVNATSVLSSVNIYDPASDTWTTGANMPTARYYSTAAVLNNKIYVFGGNNSDVSFYSASNSLATVEEYDPATDTWRTMTSMPTIREGAAAATVNDKVYVIGGGDTSGLELKVVEQAVLNPVLAWTAELNYTSSGVAPATGTLSTNFAYRVKYTHDGNIAPKSGYPKVHIKKGGVEITVSPFTMTAADVADTTYSDGKLYYYNISGLIPGNDYTYYFEGLDANDQSSVGAAIQSSTGPTVDNPAPTLDWTGETNYESDGLDPEQAPPSEPFIYRIKYTDTENDSPQSGYPKLHIKKGGVEITGSPFTMTETDATDITYSDGKLYAYSATLTDGNNLTYYFEAFDIYDAAATGTPTTEIDAPDVQNDAPVLTLVSGGISPSTPVGPATLFTFIVQYKDADNNSPKAGYPKIHIKKNDLEITGSPFTMSKISGNFNTGAIYQYQISNLTSGTNTFEFEAYDYWNAPATAVGGSGPVIPSISGTTYRSGNLFANVYLVLYYSGSPIASTYSNNSGNYEFLNLTPRSGYYSITAQYDIYFGQVHSIDGDANVTNLNIGLIKMGPSGNTAIVGGANGKVNPTKNEKARICFLPADAGTVTVKIYNIVGELIWDFSKEVNGDIQDNIEWNGKNNDGNVVASGIYLVYIQGCGLRAIEKVAVIK